MYKLRTSGVLLAFILILAVSSKLLHTQTTTADPNIAYYDALMARENDLKAQLAQIQNSITLLNTTLAQVQNQTSIQVVALEDTLAD